MTAACGPSPSIRRLVTAVLFSAVAGFFCPCRAHAAAPEVRGTWLTTTGVDHIKSGNNTAAVVADLRAIGLNTVYVETWKNGYTNFPSPRLAQITGGVDRSTFLGTTRDLVEETLIEAHRNQMAYYGWFEYGFAAQFVGSGGSPSNPLGTYMRDRGWLLQNQSGQYADSTNGFAWMNPAVPEVRQFLIDVTLDAVNRYDLDGIQFDDRLAWPVQFGFDATTLALYAEQTGRPAPSSPTNAQFSQWRRDKVTEFAAELYSAVKTARPDLQVSVAPSITSFSTTNYNADWPTWASQKLFDEFAVQAYRDNLSSFNSIINGQVAPFKPDDLDKLVLGLRINGTGATTPYVDLQAMIERSRSEGAAGHSLWYSAGARDLYSDELTAFYDVAGQGHAPQPRFAEGHRPAPIVAGPMAGQPGVWSVEVAIDGRYRVVAKIGGNWKEVSATTLVSGLHELNVGGATLVELLADRRGFTPGDFNGDDFVDGVDLDLWQTAFGTGESSDADSDGDVDGVDFLYWQSSFGRTPLTAGPVAVIPEPGSAILALAALVGGSVLRARRW